MKSALHGVALCCVAAALCSAPGCGSATYEYPEATTPVKTKVEFFKESLQAYANSGTLDSGAELLISEVDGLEAEGLANVAEVKSAVEAMVAAKSPSDVKKKAEEALKLLP